MSQICRVKFAVSVRRIRNIISRLLTRWRILGEIAEIEFVCVLILQIFSFLDLMQDVSVELGNLVGAYRLGESNRSFTAHPCWDIQLKLEYYYSMKWESKRHCLKITFIIYCLLDLDNLYIIFIVSETCYDSLIYLLISGIWKSGKERGRERKRDADLLRGASRSILDKNLVRFSYINANAKFKICWYLHWSRMQSKSLTNPSLSATSENPETLENRPARDAANLSADWKSYPDLIRRADALSV